MKLSLFIFLIFTPKSFGQTNTEVDFTSMEEALVNPLIVKSLDLSDKHITQLSNEIIRLTNLEKINIGSNPGLDLSQAFDLLKQIKGLKELVLSSCKIKTIPDNISQLRNLEDLSLDDNELAEFPDPIKQLKSLKYLDLFSNKIKKLHFKNGELSNLIYINLCYNEFKIFPVQLSVLPNLKRIIIWNNSIREIPKGIGRLKNIEEINLEGNNLTSLPRQFGQLESIRKLCLRDNQLSDSRISIIYKLQNLKDLDLQGNNIKVLSDKIENLRNLERLSVCDNPLKELPANLEHVNTLQQLGLGDLHYLNWTNAFAIMEKLPNLKRVGMYAMKLSMMPVGFEKLQQVDIFWLTFNSFNKDEKKRIQEMVPKAKIEFE